MFTNNTLLNLFFPTASKRLRGAELAETIALAAGHLTNGTQNSNTSYNTNNTSNNGSSSSSGGAIPANVPINASAEVAAGRTKIGRSSFWNEERVSILFFFLYLFFSTLDINICVHDFPLLMLILFYILFVFVSLRMVYWWRQWRSSGMTGTASVHM